MKAYYYVDFDKPLPQELQPTLKKILPIKDFSLKSLMKLDWSDRRLSACLSIAYLNGLTDINKYDLVNLIKATHIIGETSEHFSYITNLFKG